MTCHISYVNSPMVKMALSWRAHSLCGCKCSLIFPRGAVGWCLQCVIEAFSGYTHLLFYNDIHSENITRNFFSKTTSPRDVIFGMEHHLVDHIQNLLKLWLLDQTWPSIRSCCFLCVFETMSPEQIQVLHAHTHTRTHARMHTHRPKRLLITFANS